MLEGHPHPQLQQCLSHGLLPSGLRYNHKVNKPQGLLALVKHLALTLVEHPPHNTR